MNVGIIGWNSGQDFTAHGLDIRYGGTGAMLVPAATDWGKFLQLNYATGALELIGPNLENLSNNGSVQIVQQNGTSSVTLTSGSAVFPADEWRCASSGASMTAQQVANPNASSEAATALKITGATSGTTCQLGERIEAKRVRRFKRPVCYAWSVQNNTAGDMVPTCRFVTPTVSDNFASLTVVQTVTLQFCPSGATTTVWCIVDVSSSAYTDIDKGLQIELTIPSGSLDSNSKNVIVTERRYVAATTLVPYCERDYDADLWRCLRYFQIIGEGVASTRLGLASEVGASPVGNEFHYCLLRPMRTVPSIAGMNGTVAGDFTFSNGTAATACTGLSLSTASNQHLTLSMSHAGSTMSGNQVVEVQTNATAKLSVDARL